jgi:ubiquinone/menaquinone biosynthesis C-methylase UbiE
MGHSEPLQRLGLSVDVTPPSADELAQTTACQEQEPVATFQDTAITAIDVVEQRVNDILAVREGGFQNLDAKLMDVCSLSYADDSFDVVTALEVLEHLERPGLAISKILRATRRFAILSVPSKPDRNPEHIQLFSGQRLATLCREHGAKHVNIEYVHNHMLAVVSV